MLILQEKHSIMNKLFLIILFFFTLSAFAQDTLYFKTGERAICKVIEINQLDIKFKRFDHLDGPNISVPKNDILKIAYQSGKIEEINSEIDILSDEELIKATAVKDAYRFYRGYQEGFKITLGSCIVFTPIGGIFVAKKHANQTLTKEDIPKLVKVRGSRGAEWIPNQYYDNEIYQKHF